MFTEDQKTKITLLKIEMCRDFMEKVHELPNDIARMIKEYGTLSGGCSASYFHHDTPNDYDVYLATENEIQQFKALIELPSIKEHIADVNPNYTGEFLVDGKVVTPRAVMFKNKIQVITMDTTNARKSFDFIHCLPYYNVKENKYYISESQYQAIQDKRLIINAGAKVLAERIAKYIIRGWKLV